LQALFISYYPGVAARVALFLYEVKVLTPEGNYIHSGVIVAACFVRLWCINVLMFYLPSAIIERVFASKYVADYERCPRPLINRAIISIVYIYSAITPIFNMLGKLLYALSLQLFICTIVNPIDERYEQQT
ncbi:hypothetical protein COOONC_25693, partial [Cooperia oncophora]